MIVTIDGPAGAGKSSAARLLAQRLGFEFLDTGAMYRAVTLAILRGRCNLADADCLRRLLDAMRLEMPPGRVVLDGEDVTVLIRTPEVTAGTGAKAIERSLSERVSWVRLSCQKSRATATYIKEAGITAETSRICAALASDQARRIPAVVAARPIQIFWRM